MSSAAPGRRNAKDGVGASAVQTTATAYAGSTPRVLPDMFLYRCEHAFVMLTRNEETDMFEAVKNGLLDPDARFEVVGADKQISLAELKFVGRVGLIDTCTVNEMAQHRANATSVVTKMVHNAHARQVAEMTASDT